MESHIDLYREDGDAAWDRMTRQWPNLRRSLLMRVQLIRIGMRHLRARCAWRRPWPWVRRRRCPGSVRRRRARRTQASSASRCPGGTPWPSSFTPRSPRAAAIGQEPSPRLEPAGPASTSCDMRNLAAVARRRRGELIGGDEGRALIDQVNSWMTTQKIRKPGPLHRHARAGVSRLTAARSRESGSPRTAGWSSAAPISATTPTRPRTFAATESFAT